MDFTFTDAERALAREFRDWLAGNLAEAPAFETIEDEFAWGRRWQALMAEHRWVAIDWSVDEGGRGASPLDVALVNLEYGRSGAPQLVNRVGLNLAGPTLRAWGTDEQRKRWLPAIVDASQIWCQLFSEPGAGSDLASLRTRAERTDGGWRLSGQKVWTSYAQFAAWGLCLARTRDSERPHDGISYLAVDMTGPGVTVRPLRQITGDSEFNEVFLDDVFVPDDCLIGPEHEGWKVGRTTLAHERGSNFPIKEQTLHERYLAALARHQVFRTDVRARDELARISIGLHLLTVSNLRTLAALSRGEQPGPESSVTKMQWTSLTKRLSRLWLRVDPASRAAQKQFLWSFASGIAGGTDEVQRNIIAERILGLPRD
jgi:alkylation response protein AidB-like acyl-CoA dehydrogenase